MIKRIIIYSLLGFVLYKGANYYMWYRFVNNMVGCGDLAVLEEMQKNKPLTPENLEYVATAWACVKEKQNFADAIFFKIPANWLNLPSKP